MKFLEMSPLEKLMSFIETVVHILRPPLDLIPWKIRDLLDRLYYHMFDEFSDDHCLICYSKWRENMYIGQDLNDIGFSDGQIKWLFKKFEGDDKFFKKVMYYCANIQRKKYT